MNTMTMTCVCTEEVYSIVLLPNSSKVIFNTSTNTVLENGVELAAESKSVTVELPAALLKEVLALNVAPMPV